MTKYIFFFFCGLILSDLTYAQRFGNAKDLVEMGETMEEFLRENHLEDIETMVHQFTESRMFMDYLLQQGHHINGDSLKLRRKDISIGKDIDVYVKHFTEHQNFTMLLVPVDIYPLMIYDTLLFSVIEVSDSWLHERYYHHNLSSDSVKSALLSTLNHDLLTKHMFGQVMEEHHQENAEVEVHLHESYISTNSIFLNLQEIEKNERHALMHSWGAMKRIFAHNVEMNVEMNVYLFGYDDMRIIHYTDSGAVNYRITPGNVFTRHRFVSE